MQGRRNALMACFNPWECPHWNLGDDSDREAIPTTKGVNHALQQ